MNRQLEIFAKTLFGEARGTNKDDRQACALVIRNRVIAARKHKARTGRNHPLFGDGTYEGACLTPWQFSCWNTNDPNRKVLEALNPMTSLHDGVTTNPDRLAFTRCFAVALEVMAGDVPDYTKGSLHYHTIAMGWPKSWGNPKTPVYSTRWHHFYNNVD